MGLDGLAGAVAAGSAEVNTLLWSGVECNTGVYSGHKGLLLGGSLAKRAVSETLNVLLCIVVQPALRVASSCFGTEQPDTEYSMTCKLGVQADCCG